MVNESSSVPAVTYKKHPEWPIYRRLWVGQAVSSVGNSFSAVALPLLAVLTLEATPFEIGMLTAAQFVSYLGLSLIVGVWVDKLDRRKVMLRADLARALLTALVPILAFTGLLALWQLYIIAIALSVLMVLFDTAYQSFIPMVVTGERRLKANSRQFLTDSVTQTAGPTAGGSLVQFIGAPWALVIDALSFMASYSTLESIAVSGIREPADDAPLKKRLAEGFRFVQKDKILVGMTAFLTYSNALIYARTALIVLFLVRTVHAWPWLVGLLLACEGVGMLVGSLLVEPLIKRFRPGLVLGVVTIIEPMFALLIPATHLDWRLACFIVGTIVADASALSFTIIGINYRQHVTPNKLMGRVTAIMRTFSRGALPIGAAVGGVLGTMFGLRGGIMVACLFLLASPIWIPRAAWGLTRADIGMEEVEPAT